MLLLAGCHGPSSIDRFVPSDADVRARNVLSLLTRGQADSAADRLLPQLHGTEATTQIRGITDLLRNERFDTTRVIGAQVNTINGIRHVNLTYELHSSFSWFLASVATVDSANAWFVEGMSARTIPEPLEVSTQFARANRTAAHYLWLILMVAAAIGSLATATFLAAQRGMPRRWLWVALALVGVGAFRLNWTTGAVGLQPIYFTLLSAAAMRGGPAAPWILTFAIPAGAIVGLVRYRQWHARVRISQVSVSASQAAI